MFKNKYKEMVKALNEDINETIKLMEQNKDNDAHNLLLSINLKIEQWLRIK